MRITFILPGFIRIPMGGVKIVQEYANRLAQRGHAVTLVYPLELKTGNRFYDLKKKLSGLLDKLNHVAEELYYTPAPEVNVLVVKQVTSRYIPEGDAVVAVGWQTAAAVLDLPEIHGRKFYLLQSFETYFSNAAKILQTYRLPLKKIAISQWIIDELALLGEQGFGPLGNAIDPDEFYLTETNQARPFDVIFLYHPHRIKGARAGLNILRSLKRNYPECRVVIVAARQPVHRFPKWIELRIRPSVAELRELYNSAKILLHTSRWEGWGLPVMEAMACGCSVVAWRNRGVQEFLQHESNALLVPIGDLDASQAALQTLLHDGALRARLRDEGLKTVKEYDWPGIIDQLENILQSEI